MALTKVTTKGITDNAVDGDKLAPGSVTTAKIGGGAVESSEIGNGTVTADDLASTLDLSPKTVTLSGSTVDALKRPVQDNIALLGFKMAVNDGLTVFNLVDGVVDEFHDESGTDEGEGSNDLYNASNDFYINSTSPDGTPIGPTCYSAGFSLTAVSEPETSTAGTNPTAGCGAMGTFTVPAGMTAASILLFGAGGGVGSFPTRGSGGQGGDATGTLAVTPGQALKVAVGEGGSLPTGNKTLGGGARGDGSKGGNGGGLSGIFSEDWFPLHGPSCTPNVGCSTLNAKQPTAYIIAGGAGGGAWYGSQPGFEVGGFSGGGPEGTPQGTGTCATPSNGGGGDQEAGGQGAGPQGQSGGVFLGGKAKGPQNSGGGGGGYFGGGGGMFTPGAGGGGGGSGYISHPQITSGATSITANNHPQYTPSLPNPLSPAYMSIGSYEYGTPGQTDAGEGFVLITGSASISAAATSTTIVSNAFAAGSVPTTSRIVVFEENVDTPTLNTDIIASISRDGGSNFTTATLSDSGYVTGSSGQRILTGQATISGQPSGQSMRWKLALANNQVKIHGVSLQWA